MKKTVIILLNLLWASLTWRLTTTPNLVVAPENWLNTLMMMGGHFTFFGVQAVLLRYMIHDIRYTKYSNYISIAAASLYGLIIELVQLSVPGRSADPFDWLLDTLGTITFLAIMNNIKISNKFSNF